ncbi:MAG: hypothetical protein KatS3mg096_442 [Candidatus Parcubacteria bacterium]|nr:MAG: hypothetical protein KatS3mg096_442 [Candidatus Parcubacteria bacterium]
MGHNQTLNKIYLKIAVFTLIFLLITVGYFFILNFYSQKTLAKINEINNLKEKLIQNQATIESQNKIKKIVSLIEQKTGKELKTILFEANQKLDRDFETTKNLVNEKLQKENWSIQTTSFNQQEKKLTFIFQLPESDLEKFSNFMIESGLIWQTINFKIDKINNNLNIELNLQTK